MATTVLYRINSGEVLKISLGGQTFADRDSTYFGVLTDPSFPDGTAIREDLGTGDFGPRRELGFAKFPDVGAGVVRHATAPEIALWPAAEAEDNNQLDADAAADFADVHPRFRKIFKAVLRQLINELFAKTNAKNNEMIVQWNQHKADVVAAGNLNDIKTSTAALAAIAANLDETVTLAQAVTKLKNDISKDD